MKSNPQLLSNNFLKPTSAKNQQRSTLPAYSPIYVKKWVDYSSKYGLGYLLSDGSTGIYFNDSSKMVLDDQGQYLCIDLGKWIILETIANKLGN